MSASINTIASVTSRCVDTWLDMKRMVLMDFGHLTDYILTKFTLKGLSIMYGTPHQHIWTFAAGFNENHVRNYDCSCNDRWI